MNKKNIQYSKITFIILFIFILLLSFKIVASYLMAIAIGNLLALALSPLQEMKFFKKMKPNHSAYLIMVGLILIIILPLVLFVTSFINQAIQIETYFSNHEAITFLPLIKFINNISLINHFVGDATQIQIQIDLWITGLSKTISSTAIKLLQEIPYLLVQTFFSLLSCLVFLIDGKRFSIWISDKIPLDSEIKKSLTKAFRRSSTSAFFASMAASGTQALGIFISFLIFNIPVAFLASGATFIFNFIPVIGAAPLWILGFAYLYWKASYLKLIILLCISLIFSLLENIVRVHVLKGPKNHSALIELVAVFGGLEVFGFLGVLIGPIIVALLISMCEVWPEVWNENLKSK